MTFSSEELSGLLSNFNPKYNNNGDGFVINCPECNKRECQISIAKESHPFNCFRKKKCGASGNIFTFQKYGVDLGIITERLIKENRLSAIPLSFAFNHVPQQRTLPILQRVPVTPYMYNRTYGQVNETYIDPWRQDYQYLPVKERGEIVGYMGRDVTDTRKSKYDNHVDSGQYIYNIDSLSRDTKILIICEGAFSCHAASYKLGTVQTSDVRVVATFGANITSTQISKIKNIVAEDCMVFLLHERDVLKEVKKVMEEISIYFNSRYCPLPLGIDPDDATQDQIWNAMENSINLAELNIMMQ